MIPDNIHALTDSLDLLNDTYNYNHWIYSLLRPFLGERVLEVGAGTGNITQFLLRCQRVVCLDIEDKYLSALAKTAKIHSNVTPIKLDLLDLPSDEVPSNFFDTALCINVLEHIENDLDALAKILSVLKPGGKLLLYVPASNWAFGSLDTALGHFRRYSRHGMKQLVETAGGNLHKCHYVNFIGVFGWYWAGRIRKDEFIQRGNAHLVDTLVPYLSAFERLVRPPIGQSLYAVIEKPHSNMLSKN